MVNFAGKRLIFLLAVLFLASFIAFLNPVSAQTPNIEVLVDQADYTNADFTIDESITLDLTGTFNITDYSGQVYFGIYAPDSWDTQISPEGAIVTLGASIEFEGSVTPPTNAPQNEHEIYVWASIDKPSPTLVEITSSTSDVFSHQSIINIIQNRVQLITGVLENKILPSSILDYEFTVTNVGTVEDTFLIDLVGDQALRDQGFVITQSHEELTLQPGETGSFSVQQGVPSDAEEGDYEFDVVISSTGHVMSRQTRSVTSYVRIPEMNSPFRLDWMLLFMVGFVGTGLGVATIIAATEYGYLAFISLFLPLYVRLKKKDVLSHFTRGQIFGYIQANPGAHYNAIIQDLNLHNGVGAYHLQVLEREGFIKSLRDGIYKRFYPKSMSIPEKKLHLSRIQRDVLTVIQKYPGATQKQLSKLLNESKQVINYHVKILESSGLIRLERVGRETACFAGDVKYVQKEDVYQLTDEKGQSQVMHL